MKNKDFQSMCEQLAARLPLVMNAIKHLHRVTGKCALDEIDPLEEKRWSERCWKDYGIIVEVYVMLQEGRPWTEILTERIAEMRPEDGWIGQVKVGEFPPFGSTEEMKARIEKMFPKFKIKKED